MHGSTEARSQRDARCASDHPAVNRKVVSWIPVWGAKRIQGELLCLPINCGTADILAKWPILVKAAFLTKATTVSWLAQNRRARAFNVTFSASPSRRARL